MTPRAALSRFVLVIAVAALIGWGLFVGLPRWYAPPATPASRADAAAARRGRSGRTIKARLFYVSEDGSRLTPVERDVPYADEPNAQARASSRRSWRRAGDAAGVGHPGRARSCARSSSPARVTPSST